MEDGYLDGWLGLFELDVFIWLFNKRSALFERVTDRLSVCKSWLFVFSGREVDRGIKRRVDCGWDVGVFWICIDVWRHWSTLRRGWIVWLQTRIQKRKENRLYDCQS